MEGFFFCFISSSNTFKHLFRDYETALLKELQYIFSLPRGGFVCLFPYRWVFYCPPKGVSWLLLLRGYSSFRWFK